LRSNQELQKRLGVKDVRMVTADEVRAKYPQLRTDDVLGASFCPTDGFVDPYSAMTGFTQWALEHGAQIWRDTEVTGLKIQSGRIASVATSKGEISTHIVVNAAGAWAAQIAKLAGVDLPVQPLRRMLVPTEPFDGFPRSAPMIIDMSNGFHFRPEEWVFCWPGTIRRDARLQD